MKSIKKDIKQIKPRSHTILQNIKLIFLNPYHYTYVIQKEDNYIYLYDELTMDIVGKTKITFHQNFKIIAFTDNFNLFCAYIEGKIQQNQPAQIMIFNLQHDGVINHHRHLINRNKVQQNLSLFSIAIVERQKEKEKVIVGLSKNKIHYIGMSGQIIKDMDIRHENNSLNLINGFCIKQNKWLFVEQQNHLYFVTISYDTYTVEDHITLTTKISSIFLDASVRNQFMAFITDIQTVKILTKAKEKWIQCHQFSIPNLFIKKLCFFYPGVNTSTTNKFKNKLFLLIYGQVNYIYVQKHHSRSNSDITSQCSPLDDFVIPKQYLEENVIYIHEYCVQELTNINSCSNKKIKPKNIFCIRNIGTITHTIWANQHEQNSIRIFNQDKTIRSLNLLPLLPGQYTAKEWVSLGFRFEPESENIIFQESEDSFQKESKSGLLFQVKAEGLREQELNDWSYSLFSKDVVMKKSIKRLNCISFQ